jgi:hypothetical protein
MLTDNASETLIYYGANDNFSALIEGSADESASYIIYPDFAKTLEDLVNSLNHKYGHAEPDITELGLDPLVDDDMVHTSEETNDYHPMDTFDSLDHSGGFNDLIDGNAEEQEIEDFHQQVDFDDNLSIIEALMDETNLFQPVQQKIEIIVLGDLIIADDNNKEEQENDKHMYDDGQLVDRRYPQDTEEQENDKEQLATPTPIVNYAYEPINFSDFTETHSRQETEDINIDSEDGDGRVVIGSGQSIHVTGW